MDTLYQNNVGLDETVVFDGSLTVSTQATGPPEGPRGFDYVYNFTTPFFYDPDLGNLLVEIISPSGYVPAERDDQDSRVAQISGGSATAAGGVRNVRGVVIQFIFIPEPSTFVLTAIALAALLAFGWRRRV